MPEPNTSDRNSHGSRVHEISARKIATRFSGRLPTTRYGEEDRRLLRFSNGFWFFLRRSITHADRDGGRKLTRLRRGFAGSVWDREILSSSAYLRSLIDYSCNTGIWMATAPSAIRSVPQDPEPTWLFPQPDAGALGTVEYCSLFEAFVRLDLRTRTLWLTL
jgi:hypothetical protein